MNKFSFPLGRVMDWRRTQERIEEGKLEQLHAELRAIDAQEAVLNLARAQSERELVSAGSVTGFQLAALDAFKRYTIAERARIGVARAGCRQRIRKQIEILTVKRREVRLLEQLREQNLKKWQAGLWREIDRDAEELYAAKWNSKRLRPLE